MNNQYLKNQGRMGDTELRQVDGKESHVNTWEAFLIDSYGESGEQVVKAVGSGTQNPKTGIPEYKTDAIGGQGADDRSWVEQIFTDDPNEGFFQGMSEWWHGDEEERTGQKATALATLSEGIKGISADLGRFIGEGGIVEQEQDITTKRVRGEVGTGFKQVGAELSKAISQSNLAYSGTAETTAEEARSVLQDQFDIQIAGADVSKRKSVATYKEQARQKLEALKSNYQATIDDMEWPWYSDDYDEASGYQELQSEIS